ncbi:MAG: T9SS type A sorting domain-containing protein, partial [Chitinophagales bacterium]|nr:T9SS type A sorting domain-containing protein [Chitinophagales bacterium]
TGLTVSTTKSYAVANVKLTTSSVAVTDWNQGTSNVIVYPVFMEVTTDPVTVNNITFTMTGNHDNNDLTNAAIYFNATAPNLTGASFLNSTSAAFAAPHLYSVSINRTIAAGDEGYFIVVVSISATGTDNNTVQINGDTDPVTFGYTSAVITDNQQTNKAKAQKIQAADIVLTTSSVPVTDWNQGTSNVIIYPVLMAVTTMPVTANNITFTMTGTHDANDLTNAAIYFNATAPNLTGASFLNSTSAAFAAPHTYSVSINRTIAAGDQGYFIIVASISSTGTDNKTVQINGVDNPVTFGFTTAPNVDNQQTNKAKAQKIQAADIVLTTSSVPVADWNQGTSNVIIYPVLMTVATMPVTANNITFTMTGTHDANDLTNAAIYFNATAPNLTGASFLNSTSAAFAAPHTYSVSINRTIAAGDQGYFIIVASISSTGTDNKTIQINGTDNPVTFGYTTAPNVDNQQTNKAKAQKIQAADIVLTTSSVPVTDWNQGTSNVIIYPVLMKVTTMPVTANNITFTMTGTHDANDLTNAAIYFNATAPNLTGASFLNSTSAAFAAPHTYSVSINRTVAAGDQGYFIIVASISTTGTDNKTVQINGADNPVTFGFTTAPNVDNQQTNKAKAQKIQAADIVLTTSSVPVTDWNQGTSNVIIYPVLMAVSTMPVTANNITFTMTGTHDANDLTNAAIYFNATAPNLTGASFLNSTSAAFAAPHTYSVSINRTIVAGDQGYFIIVASISSTGTDNKTIQINGTDNPVTFGYTTAPNVVNQQSNLAKAQKIQAADLIYTTSTISSGNILQGSSNNIVYATLMEVATMPVTVNNITFTLSGTHDNNDLTSAAIYFNATAPNLTGASFLNSISATFAAPHLYSVSINRTIAAGDEGYFIIVVSINATATINNTVTINGSTNPATFGFTTAPNVVDNQTNNAGTKTIKAGSPKATGTATVALAEIYPNPANASFNYSLSGNEDKSILVRLLDQSGKTMVSEKLNIATGANNFSMNVSHLSNGVYYLLVSDEQQSIRLSKQVVVQH